MKVFLENPPECLKKKGDKNAQKDFLMQKGVVNIYENLELRFKEGCENGIKYYFPEEMD